MENANSRNKKVINKKKYVRRRKWKHKRGPKQKKDDPVVQAKKLLPNRTFLGRASAARVQDSAKLTGDTFLLHTEQSGFLAPEKDLEKTLHVTQAEIKSQVDLATAAKSAFRLDLSSSNLSPYTSATYSRSGRSLLIASRKGHVSMCNWRHKTLNCELHLNETVRSATFLHNDAFFALSQKEFAFIYDSSGSQVHVLRSHREPGAIVSLPHHLLLATISAPTMAHSDLVYTDTSNGEVIGRRDFGQRSLGLYAATSASVNLANGVIHLAHNSGAVSMWSPTVERPLARVFCHGGGVRHVAMMPSGDAMVTVGADAIVKVTDLRTFRTRTSWRLPAVPTALTTSQRELIALSFGATVQVWAIPGSSAAKAAKVEGLAPYMTETFSGKRTTNLDFCPFEDFLAVCHSNGVFSMIVPGSGEATFDTSAPNPYETRKQRRENVVRSLLDKLPPSTIALNSSFVASVDPNPVERLRELQRTERDANIAALRGKQTRKRAKGRDKISKRLKRRESNIIAARRIELKEELEEQRKTLRLSGKLKEKDDASVATGIAAEGTDSAAIPTALNRFRPKSSRDTSS